METTRDFVYVVVGLVFADDFVAKGVVVFLHWVSVWLGDLLYFEVYEIPAEAGDVHLVEEDASLFLGGVVVGVADAHANGGDLQSDGIEVDVCCQLLVAVVLDDHDGIIVVAYDDVTFCELVEVGLFKSGFWGAAVLDVVGIADGMFRIIAMTDRCEVDLQEGVFACDGSVDADGEVARVCAVVGVGGLPDVTCLQRLAAFVFVADGGGFVLDVVEHLLDVGTGVDEGVVELALDDGAEFAGGLVGIVRACCPDGDEIGLGHGGDGFVIWAASVMQHRGLFLFEEFLQLGDCVSVVLVLYLAVGGADGIGDADGDADHVAGDLGDKLVVGADDDVTASRCLKEALPLALLRRLTACGGLHLDGKGGVESDMGDVFCLAVDVGGDVEDDVGHTGGDSLGLGDGSLTAIAVAFVLGMVHQHGEWRVLIAEPFDAAYLQVGFFVLHYFFVWGCTGDAA